MKCDCCDRDVPEKDIKRKIMCEDIHPGCAIVILRGHEKHWITVKEDKNK